MRSTNVIQHIINCETAIDRIFTEREQNNVPAEQPLNQIHVKELRELDDISRQLLSELQKLHDDSKKYTLPPSLSFAGAELETAMAQLETCRELFDSMLPRTNSPRPS